MKKIFLTIVLFIGSIFPCRTEATQLEERAFRWTLGSISSLLGISTYFLISGLPDKERYEFWAIKYAPDIGLLEKCPNLEAIGEAKNFIFGNSNYIPNGHGYAKLIFNASLTKDLVIFSSTDIMLTHLTPQSPLIAPFFFAGGLAAPMIGMIAKFIIASRKDPIMAGKKMTKTSFLLTGSLIASLSALRIAHHAYNIFFKKKKEPSKNPTFTLMPVYQPFSIGLSASFIF